jgi:hypothetical protein
MAARVAAELRWIAEAGSAATTPVEARRPFRVAFWGGIAGAALTAAVLANPDARDLQLKDARIMSTSRAADMAVLFAPPEHHSHLRRPHARSRTRPPNTAQISRPSRADDASGQRLVKRESLIRASLGA